MNARWLRRAAFLLTGMTVVFAVALAARFGSQPGLVESPLLGKPAPVFELPTLDRSGSVGIAELNGEIVVLNFFASWCLECRLEHNELVAAANAFAGTGVTFIHVSYQESPEASLRYLAEVGSSPAAFYLEDPLSRTAIAYGVFGIPETFFIDTDGTVVGKIIGETDAATIGATIDAIKRGERPGQSVTGNTSQTPND
ncbi:MAG: redoxin domain-containing protein [Acidimicrobiia bacterium]|nr:redoxin domain-containing protein [Acidimicrobiia bacterium]